MKSNLLWVIGAVLTAGKLAMAQPTAVPAAIQPAVIDASPGRPLAKALITLQHRLQQTISYEEIPFEHPQDLKRPAVVASSPSEIPAFRVTFGPTDSTPYLSATTMLQAYKNAGLPGEYAIRQHSGWVSVVPNQMMTAKGSQQSLTPVMDSKVRFPLAKRRAFETIQLLADAASAGSGKKVMVLNLPFWPQDTLSIKANGESVAEMVHKLGEATGRPVSYQCLWDARSRVYYLNLSIVAPDPVPGSTVLEPPRRKPVVGPATSPWFKKGQ